MGQAERACTALKSIQPAIIAGWIQDERDIAGIHIAPFYVIT